eukprot:TRINITY_DN11558_c0_g1_i2.p1 TRINITY_DN11558_c0_g1~~TRINITY_DN11558_c0_g1_i2.p1  ORF type:complete len:464 (+),score=149.75 TRINITY_DN11558_c0_g1_i2:49-1392(+)
MHVHRRSGVPRGHAMLAEPAVKQPAGAAPPCANSCFGCADSSMSWVYPGCYSPFWGMPLFGAGLPCPVPGAASASTAAPGVPSPSVAPEAPGTTEQGECAVSRTLCPHSTTGGLPSRPQAEPQQARAARGSPQGAQPQQQQQPPAPAAAAQGGAAPAAEGDGGAGAWRRGNEDALRDEEWSEEHLILRVLEWWRRAMDSGWVAEWVDTVMTEDVVLLDHTPEPRSIQVQGKQGLVQYYNKVLQLHFPGDSEISWNWSEVERVAPGEVRSLHRIQSWIGGKFRAIDVMYRHSLRGNKIRFITMTPLGCEEDWVLGRMENLLHWRPPPPPEGPAPPLTLGPGGVHMERPCRHNDWDNVRIKRGWIILRCRECHAQWRQRPSPEGRCHAFNTAAGCPHGQSCALLHVNHYKQTLQERQLHASSHRRGERDSGSPREGSPPSAPAGPRSAE